MSSEFFSSNHFQIGEHGVLLHTAKSKKVALVIGHMEQCNDLLEWPPDNKLPNAQLPIPIPKAAFIESAIQLFRERLSQKMCTRQSRKVIWDMVNTLFPVALENICPWPLVPFFQISSKNRVHSKPPTTPFGIVACTFSDNLARKSCM